MQGTFAGTLVNVREGPGECGFGFTRLRQTLPDFAKLHMTAHICFRSPREPPGMEMTRPDEIADSDPDHAQAFPGLS